jgi:hypothetical protein
VGDRGAESRTPRQRGRAAWSRPEGVGKRHRCRRLAGWTPSARAPSPRPWAPSPGSRPTAGGSRLRARSGLGAWGCERVRGFGLGGAHSVRARGPTAGVPPSGHRVRRAFCRCFKRLRASLPRWHGIIAWVCALRSRLQRRKDTGNRPTGSLGVATTGRGPRGCGPAPQGGRDVASGPTGGGSGLGRRRGSGRRHLGVQRRWRWQHRGGAGRAVGRGRHDAAGGPPARRAR